MLLEVLIPFIVTLIIYLGLWKPYNYHKGRKLPPGPIRWPVIGSIPAMMKIDKEYPYKQLTGLSHRYGEIMSLGLGVHYSVVLSSFKAQNDLLKRPETTQKRYGFQFTNQRDGGKNIGVVWSHGETWNEIRRFSVKKLRDFGFGKPAIMDETIRNEMDSLITHIQDCSKDSSGIWEVDPIRLSIISVNVLWSSIGGYTFDPSSEFIRRLIDVNFEIFDILRPNNLLSVLPFLKIFPEKSGYKRQGEINHATLMATRDLISDAKLKRQQRPDTAETESFVEVFLDEIEKSREIPGTLYTDEQLETVVMDLFLATTDTTSSVMQWIILYFALNQKIQERARSEILNVSENGTKRIPLTSNKKLPYVMACIMESMRHPPIAPIPPAREAISDILYEDYVIPKGTCILFNLYAVFHDAEFWGDHDVFRPERFLNSSQTALDPEKVERVPQFGYGKRICPGDSMAMDVLFGFVISILPAFRIETVPGREPSIEPGPPGLTTTPKNFVAKFIPLQ